MKQNKVLKNSLVMSFAICFIFSFLSLLFINGTTIGADDYLHSIMFGRDGFDNSLFVNYFYATFITALQKIMPGFNAFVILEILLSFLAFWGICNTLFKKFSNKTALVLSITVNGIFSCLHYFTPLWSYTAVLLCLAGSFELIYSLNNQKKKPLGIVYGIIFIILGAMIRKNQFYVCAAFLVAYYGAIIIYKCFTNRKNLKNYIKSINIKKYGSTVMLIALAIILPFGIQFVSDTINYSSDGYNDYRQYNTLRSSLNDYDYPPYVGNETFYDSIGVSENDLKMFSEWNIDEDFFTADKLTQIVDYQKSLGYRSAFYNISKTFKNFTDRFGAVFYIAIVAGLLIAAGAVFVYCKLLKKKPVTVMSVFALLLSVAAVFSLFKTFDFGILLVWIGFLLLETQYVFVYGDKKSRWVSFVMCCASAVLLGGLFVIGRYPLRTLYGPCSFAIMFVMLMLPSSVNTVFSRVKTKNVTALLLSLTATVSIFTVNVPTSRDYILYHGVENYISKNQDKFFILPSSVIMKCDRIWELKDYDNYIDYGNWDNGSVFREKILERNGLNNQFGDIIDNDKVLYASPNQEYTATIETYYNSHYASEGKTIKFIKVNEIQALGFYKVVSEEKIEG